MNTRESYNADRAAHWDSVAKLTDRWSGWGGTYHRRIREVVQHLVPPGRSVLELGCGRGDLLASLKPSDGVGVDFSAEMVARAKAAHPELKFIEGDAHSIDLGRTFDVIVLADLVNDAWDVQAVLDAAAKHARPDTRLIITFFSQLYQWPLRLARRSKMALPNLQQNWLAREDVDHLLTLSGWETIRGQQEALWLLPPVPVVEPFVNRVLARFYPFKSLTLSNVVVARPAPTSEQAARKPTVSVIVPARNESGNIAAIFDRTPEMGGGTELVFVEGNSTDDTYAAIERELAARPGRKAMLLKQPGKGKGDAVRTGYAAATGDIFMILDADLTVPPEDLPRFYDALVQNKGEFINGVRLVYPMEKEAMRFLNMVGNKFFGIAFSWLLGQPVRDTLCGTKVLYRWDYDRIAANRAYFGDFDPFGDFDLIFGAAKQNLKMIDLPIRYRERTYGSTNIQRWKHGLLLLRMTWFAAWRLKFV